MSMRTYDATAYASPGDVPASTGQEDSVSVFDRYSVFDGTFNLTRDLRVEGQVKGTINCKGTLFVAQGATVNATIEAENITVAGELEGEINCRGKMQILESGKVRGKIATATLVINEGAFYEGELAMNSGDAQNGPPTRTPRPRPTVTGSSPAAQPDAGRAPGETAGSTAAPDGNTFIRRFGGQETSWDSSGGNEQASSGNPH